MLNLYTQESYTRECFIELKKINQGEQVVILGVCVCQTGVEGMERTAGGRVLHHCELYPLGWSLAQAYCHNE